MTLRLPDDAVTVALDKVCIDSNVTFSGIDLDTGKSVTIRIEHEFPPAKTAATYVARGLLLKLSVVPVPARH